MNSLRLFPLLLAGSFLLVSGCKKAGLPPAPPAPADATAFLKWSMDRYAEMPDMQAMVEVVTTTGKQKAGDQNRTFRYQYPNKFRVEAKGSEGSVIEAVSDGTQEQDYDNLKLASSTYSAPAPASLAVAASGDMVDPSLCGSPLYGFFGGSKNFDKLVKGPVKVIEKSVGPDNEPVRIVQFDTPGLIGNVKAVIGEKKGLIYALNYDLSGAKSQIMTRISGMKGDPAEVKKLKDGADKLLQTKFTEMYMNIRIGLPLSRGSFDPNLPGAAAVAAIDHTKPRDDSPIPLNEPAPAITLKTLEGKSFSLAELKGHPVMIDFWATWCAPCRQALPETAKLQSEGKKGLKVLAITDEDAATIQGFLGKQSYKLTASRDEGDQAQKAFVVGGLPSEVFIDAKGNVIKYLVGFHPSEDVHEALKAIGAGS